MFISYQKIFTLLFIFSGTISLAQSYSWAYRAGGSSWDDVKEMHIGDDNNLLVTGAFQNVADFDTASITGWLYHDGFVAKYDQQGNIQWVNPMNSGDGQVWAIDVTSDANNNVYVTGYFQGQSVYFTPNDSLEMNAGSSRDVFLAKYNSSGVFQWARLGAGSYSTGRAVTCDSQNNVIISGSYNNTITFSGTVSPSATTGVYMAKYDGQGNLIWLKSGTSNSQCWFTDLDSDASGNIYATGKISNSITFDNQTVNNNGGDDMAIAKFNSNGDLQWMEVIGTDITVSTTADKFDCGNGIVVDQSGNIFVGGSLIDTAYWGAGGTGTHQFAIVTKYDNNGTQQWINKYGNHENDIINDVALDSNGDPYVIGNYFEDLTIGTTTFPTQSTDIRAFIAKFNANTGSPIWASEHGTSLAGENTGVGIQVNPNSNAVYSTGTFENMFDFGNNTLQSSGSLDIYLVLNNDFVSLEKLNVQDEMLIYPNPVNTTLHLSLPNKILNNAQLLIYNLSGQVVLEQQLNSYTNHIDVNALQPGNYLVTIQSENGVYRQKMVKM